MKTTEGVYIKYLKPSYEPIVIFNLGANERVLEVFSYCNIHGLYKLELQDEKEYVLDPYSDE